MWSYENIKYKNNFPKGYTPIWLEEAFMIKKGPGTLEIKVLHGEKIVGTFYEKISKR